MRARALGPVYLSSRFARRDELRGYRAELLDAGFAVTSSWLDSTDAIDPSTGRAVAPDGTHPEHEASAARMAKLDLAEVVGARVVVAFTDPPGALGASRGGRHVELGAALALAHLEARARIYVVGPREHVFHWHPVVTHCETWLACLTAIRARRRSCIRQLSHAAT